MILIPICCLTCLGIGKRGRAKGIGLLLGIKTSQNRDQWEHKKQVLGGGGGVESNLTNLGDYRVFGAGCIKYIGL